MSTFTRILLSQYPSDKIDMNTFREEKVPLASLQPGCRQLLVKVLYISVDPIIRSWITPGIHGAMEPVNVGETVRASALGVVMRAGPHASLAVDDIVIGLLGLTEYGVYNEAELFKARPATGATLQHYLGPLGFTGLAAYFGCKLGQIKAGETVVVSAAAGATGSLACQLAKRKGAHVIGIAGSDEKCAWLINDLGIDKAFNYKESSWRETFVEQVGEVDVYFDNVGGEILDFMLSRLNPRARISLCGGISSYNSPAQPGIKNYMELFHKRASITGFYVMDFLPEFPAAFTELERLLSTNSITFRYKEVKGIRNVPTSLMDLFAGKNTGKLYVGRLLSMDV
ncbi:alcohol dehydrogenase [Amylostereum chailletii]|nr:alcohol dehydrogenase [Amylostereum chailletii]